MYRSQEDDQQRLARNINDLLQELRVALAGVQILFGFLLSIVFTDTYRRASDVQHGAHLVAVLFAVMAVALMTAPVAWHRLLFRQRQRQEILRVSNGLAIAGMGCLAIAMSATIFLLADVVLGGWAAIVAGALTLAGFGFLWFVLPLRQRDYTADH
jgi:O-antigen/teichoic acid export membrane protein